MTTTPRLATRYHPLLVALHWILAVLILGLLAAGFFVLARTSGTTPEKLNVLEVHMAGGMLVLALTLVRLVTRLVTAQPPESNDDPRLALLARITHWTFYVVVIAMVVTGYATGLIAGLPDIVFARNGAPLPQDFDVYPTFIAHKRLAIVLVALIALHIAAVIYHQMMKRDALLRRMGFGRRW